MHANRISRLAILFLAFLLPLGVSACFAPREERPVYSREIARVGDFAIKEDHLRFRLKLELNKFPKGYVEKYRQKPLDDSNRLKPVLDELLKKMIEDYSILAWGQSQGIALSEDELKTRFEAHKNKMSPKDLEHTLNTEKIPYPRWKRLVEDQLRVKYVIERALGDKLKVTLPEIQAYYNKNRDKFKVRETARVRHIVTDKKEKADDIAARLKAGENFAQLAVNHSISPDRARGGDLGYIEKGTYPAVFDKAFELEKGEVSAVIKSEYGYHLFKLLDKKSAGIRPLAEVTAEIQQTLFEEKLKSAYQTWIAEVRQDVPVVLHEDTLKTFVL